MTSATSNRPIELDDPTRVRPGFTLIELILVMALLAIAFAVTFPTLRGFFRGRILDSEARRLLALTRYGLDRAVSEGMNMVLWVDAREGSYGLQAAPGYTDNDRKAVEFRLDNDLQIEVSTPIPTARLGLAKPLAASAGTGIRSILGLPTIRFQPDGFIGEASPEFLALREGEKDAVWLVQTTNRLAYELRNEPPSLVRR